MSDLETLENRIASAMARISQGLGALSDRPDAGQGQEDLAAQLEEERNTNAQLVERVRTLKERQDTKLAGLEQRVAAQAAQLAALDAELQKLRGSNAEMRHINTQLRAAAAKGVADAELINLALKAENEALLVQRSADAVEVDTILAELRPLIEESGHAPS